MLDGRVTVSQESAERPRRKLGLTYKGWVYLAIGVLCVAFWIGVVTLLIRSLMV